MRLRKLGIGAVATASAIVLTAATVYATGSTDTDDHFSLKAGTVVTGALKTGTKMTFVGSLDGIPVTVTCTGFTGKGTIPATGLSVTLATPPTFSGCTDSLSGTDTIKTNQTNGKWKLAEVDAPNDESATEPNATGDKIKLTIPKGGATFSSSFDPSCVVTVAPTAAASVSGAYNDAGTGTVKNAAVPVSASGCTAGTTTTSATVVLSPSVHDVS